MKHPMTVALKLINMVCRLYRPALSHGPWDIKGKLELNYRGDGLRVKRLNNKLQRDWGM